MERDNVGTGAAPVATGTNSPDLEVKDAQLIFGAVGRGQYQFGRRFVSGPGCLDDADRCVLRAGLPRDSGCHPSLRASAHRSPEREDFLRGEEGLPF